MTVDNYLLCLGIFAGTIGLAELIFPLRIYGIWKKWLALKIFPLHGLLLVAIGFPLTMYEGRFSKVIFVIGVFICMTGPFILLYPEKVRELFKHISEEMPENAVKKLIYFDAGVRISAGIIFITARFL